MAGNKIIYHIIISKYFEIFQTFKEGIIVTLCIAFEDKNISTFPMYCIMQNNPFKKILIPNSAYEATMTLILNQSYHKERIL